MKPATLGTIITNLRVLGISHYGTTTDKRILLEAHLREVHGFTFPSKWTGTGLVAVTNHGEIDFGTMLDDDVEFARRWTAELMRMIAGINLAEQSAPPAPIAPAPMSPAPSAVAPAPPTPSRPPAEPVEPHPVAAPAGPPRVLLRKQDAPDAGMPLLTDELRKLALLHEQGVLDAEEFKDAKRAVIARHG